MGPEANVTPEDGNSFNPIGRAMIALVLGISIVILLNLFNRGGHFTLLSALFGILLYGLLSTLDWLLKHQGGRKKPPHNPTKEEQLPLRTIVAYLWRGFLSSALKVLAGFLGLLLLPHHTIGFLSQNGNGEQNTDVNL